MMDSILLNLDQWRRCRPQMATLEEVTRLSLATQALLMGVEAFFEKTPGLKSLTLFYQPGSNVFQFRHLQHPEVDSQYGTPRHLIEHLESLLDPIRETIPFIDPFFLTTENTWAEDSSFYFYTFRPLAQMTQDAHLEACLGISLEELQMVRETKQRLARLPKGENQEPSFKIRL